MRAKRFSWQILPALTLACMVATSPQALAAKSGAARLPRGDEFKTMAAAASHCPADTVVWSSLSSSKAFHLAGSKLYGKTKHGAYVCQKDALAAGFHAAKT